MTQTQDGVERFWDVDLRFPLLSRQSVRYVAVIDDRIVGYADWRLLGDGRGFLSYICVAEEVRGRGFATLLIEKFLTDHSEIQYLALDVFVGNTDAKAFYKNLSFSGVGRQRWFVRNLPCAEDGLSVVNLSHSIARLDEFGFTSIDIIWNKNILQVGLIGHKVINCSTVETFNNNNILARIKGAFPEYNRALAILDDDVPVDLEAGVAVINESVRLQAKAPDVMAQIGKRR